MIKIKCNNGKFKEARAIIDDGSQVKLVTKDFARQLGFKPLTSYNTLSGVGGVNITTSNKTLNLFIESKIEDYGVDIDTIV